MATRSETVKWPLLKQAVEVKIEEQAEFVGWWHNTVTDKPGPGRGKKGAPSGAGFLRADAEALTQITHQQVSKWSHRLADREAYRERLYGVAWRDAENWPIATFDIPSRASSFTA